MPKLIIDNREIEVPAGTKVIEAAEQLGIMIPRFCYHPALGSVGACRVCAVAFKDGPVKGVQMSCMVDAKDEMVVSTTDPEAVDFRRQVIEWLMLNHPHDCPVCDEGGHCLLQDLTVSGGHGLRRYPGLKRTHKDQYLGPLVQHEMNRCIQCYRCSRYYQEFTGYRDLGVMGIGSRVYFGRSKPGRLESPFTGNLSDICPTGVYTDKAARFFGRRWEFERSPSICLHCSLGCNLVASARYRKVVRHEARSNISVNGYFICDRGRYGHTYASDRSRPRQILVNGQAIGKDDAFKQAGETLAQIAERFGSESIAAIGSSRSSIETLAVLQSVSRENKWQGPIAAITTRKAENLKTAVAMLQKASPISLQDIATADQALVVGADPLNEAPMLALSLRQVERKGGQVTVIDPRAIDLPLSFDHWAVHPAQLQKIMVALIQTFNKAGEGFKTDGSRQDIDKDRLGQLALQLKNAKRVAIVCGTDIVSCGDVGLASELAAAIKEATIEAGLFYIMGGPNDFATGMLDTVQPDAAGIDQILEQVEAGKIKALIVVENDLWHSYPDQKRLTAALHQLELLIVLDHVTSFLNEKAHFFIPTRTIYESGGHWVNNEARLQAAQAGFSGGESIEITADQNHPPREFEARIPGAQPIAAWQAIEELSRYSKAVRAQIPEDFLAQAVGNFHPSLLELDAAGKGERLDLDAISIKAPACSDAHERSQTESESTEMTLLLVDWTFGTEPLSAMSPALSQDIEGPVAKMHPTDIEQMGVEGIRKIIIDTEGGSIEIPLRADDTMAPGVVVIPRHHLLQWQIFADTVVTLKRSQIKPA